MNLKKSIQVGLAQKQMRQGDLARAIGIRPSSLSASAQRNSCSIQVLEKIAATLGMTVSEFIALGED